MLGACADVDLENLFLGGLPHCHHPPDPAGVRRGRKNVRPRVLLVSGVGLFLLLGGAPGHAGQIKISLDAGSDRRLDAVDLAPGVADMVPESILGR